MLTKEQPAHTVASLDLLARAVGYTHEVLGHVTADALGRPTPCAGWDLEALLRHMDDALTAFTDAAEIGYVDLRPDPVDPAHTGHWAAELVRRLEDRACALVGAWQSNPRTAPVVVGDRPLGRTMVATAGALEIAVHGWDVARACGVALPIPEPLARELLDVAPALVGDADRPTRFARPLAVHPGAGDASRLLAFLGRSRTAGL